MSLYVYQYLEQYARTTRYAVLFTLILHLGFTVYAMIYALQIFNLNPTHEFITWSNSPLFLLYLFLSMVSPFILILKTQLLFQLRYAIYVIILLQLYPLIVYGVGFSNAIFLASILYPLLFKSNKT